ncbi:MAG: hypothetical protein GY827_03690 [Cytophagales bacterium]|nr:hypothetical protein [Cytophagales bacterium]
MKNFNLALFLVTLCFCACSPNVDLKNFKATQWKNDPNGCKGERTNEIEHIKEIQEELIGMSQPQIRQVFGRPDEQFLHERMNNLNVYYIDKGTKCDTPHANPMKMTLEFNGLNQLKLVRFSR